MRTSIIRKIAFAALVAAGFALYSVSPSGVQPSAYAQRGYVPRYEPPPVHITPPPIYNPPPIDTRRYDPPPIDTRRYDTPPIDTRPNTPSNNVYGDRAPTSPTHPAYSISSPDQLNEACRNLYYGQYGNGGSYKAFAISASLRCAAAWNYSTQSSADSAALDSCGGNCVVKWRQ